MSCAFTSCLAGLIDRYLTLMVALGRGYALERRVLTHLDRHLSRHHSRDLSCTEFDEWCKSIRHMAPGWRRVQMYIVRKFCLYRRRSLASAFVPDTLHFPDRPPRELPYIFSDRDIRSLLLACSKLRRTTQSPLRPHAFRLAVVLLYTSGLRRGELLGFALRDYDPAAKTLLIRETKFYKSRYIPLSADGDQELQRYLVVRGKLGFSMRPDSPLFYNGNAQRRTYSIAGLQTGLYELMDSCGIRKANGRVPRVHDFRHGFAIRSLLRWYHAGADVQSKLPLLSAYMGHISISSTEYYLSFVPELAAAASERFRARCGSLIEPQCGGKVHE